VSHLYFYLKKFNDAVFSYYESENEDDSFMEITCRPTAISFHTCTYARHNGYPHTTDVGLKCTTNGKSFIVVLVAVFRFSFTESAVRLYDFAGSTSGIPSGRLEYFVNQTWGTVCSSHFGTDLLDEACSQLGFTNSDRYDEAHRATL